MKLKKIDYVYSMREITDIVDTFFGSPTEEKYYRFGTNSSIVGLQNIEEHALKKDTLNLFFKLNSINRWLTGEGISAYDTPPNLNDIEQKKKERQRTFSQLQKILFKESNVDNGKKTRLTNHGKLPFESRLSNQQIEVIHKGLKDFMTPNNKELINYALNGGVAPDNFTDLTYKNKMTDALMCYLLYEIITSKLKLGEMFWAPAYRLKIKNPDKKRERYYQNKTKKPSNYHIIDKILEKL